MPTHFLLTPIAFGGIGVTDQWAGAGVGTTTGIRAIMPAGVGEATGAVATMVVATGVVTMAIITTTIIGDMVADTGVETGIALRLFTITTAAANMLRARVPELATAHTHRVQEHVAALLPPV